VRANVRAADARGDADGLWHAVYGSHPRQNTSTRKDNG
jgi:hypothetical protein